MSRGRAFRRLLALPIDEVVDLVEAQLALLSALWLVRRRPQGGLLRPVGRGARRPLGDESALVARIAIAVDRVSRRGVFRPTCLVRAIALENLLRRRQVNDATVRVGVAREHGALLAHAWIELAGRVVGDEPAHVRRFVPLHDFSAFSQ